MHSCQRAATENPEYCNDGERTRTWRWASIASLLICSPLLSELLSGSVKLSTLPVLIPATGVWGCAALLIREFVRWRRGDWRMTLTLGIALAVAEECVIQQTSLAPLISFPVDEVYGRWFGVNWEYFLWAVGFESVWAVVAPIAFIETLFPAVREERWLSRRGVVICSLVFLCCSFVAWFAWTQVFIPKFFPESAYTPPLLAFVLSLAVIAALIGLANWFVASVSKRSKKCPSPRLVVVFSFLWAFAWFSQVLLAFGIFPALPPGVAFSAGVALGIAAILIASRWVSSRYWSTRHTMAAILGLVFATACGGAIALTVGKATTVDRIGHLVLNAAAIVWLACRLWSQSGAETKHDSIQTLR
jgi:hypothetical protein